MGSGHERDREENRIDIAKQGRKHDEKWGRVKTGVGEGGRFL